MNAVKSGYYSNPDSTAKKRTEIKLNDFSEECNTQTFKMKLMAPAGEKVSLVSFVYLPSNNLLILSNTTDNNGQTNGWLTTMKNDGTILTHQKLLLDGITPVELFEGNCNLSGKITIAGKVASASTQSFVTQLSAIDYAPVWTRKFTHTNNVDEVALGVFQDSLVSFAARTGNEVQFGVINQGGNLKWSRTFSHPSLKKLVGIEGSYSGNIPLIMALNVLEGSKKKLLLLAHESSTGNFKSAHFAGENSNDEHTGTDLKSFNDRVILSGNYLESASSSQKIFRHILYGTKTTETVHTYDGVPTAHDSTQLVMSVAGEWLSWVPDQQEAVSFIRHPAYYQIGPERGGTIEVPGAKEVKAVAAMQDGGYLMGLNLKDQSAIYLVKTDSIGRMAGCSAYTFNPRYSEILGTDNILTNFTTNSAPVSSGIHTLQYQAVLPFSTSFECKGLYCPPAPVTDSCLSSYYKVYRSNSYVSSFSFSFDLGDDLAIQTARYTQLAGGLNSVIGSLKLYDKHGLFKRGVRYLYNGQPIDMAVYPLTKTSFLGLFYVAPTSNDSVRYMVALMDSQLQPVWTRWITSKNPSPFYSGTGYFADATTDEEGNIYLMGTTLGFMENPRITIHKLNSQGNAVWTSSVAVDKTNLLGARIQAVGNHLVVVAEGGPAGSISLRVNKISGDPVNAFLFNNGGAGIMYRRTFDWVGDRFMYSGNDGKEDFMMATFDSTARPIKIRTIENSGALRAGAASKGHIYASFNYFNGSVVKEVLLKADSNLNLVFAREYEMERARYPAGLHVQDNGEIIVPGKFFYGGVNSHYVDPYIRKFDAAGNLGTCTNSQMLNTLTDVDAIAEAITPTRVTQLLSTYPGINITVIPFNEAEHVADILCKSTNNCNSIELTGKDTVCSFSETFSYETVLNNECSLNPAWNYDTSMVQRINEQGNKLELRFKKTGKTLIRSTINAGCSIITDSILVEVQKSPASFSIGVDTIICSGETVVLNAGTGFNTYKWQDGSNDSTFTANKPGVYFVTTTNACQDQFSDTILISGSILPPLSAGADSSVCTGTNFQRLASDGFASYEWKNITSQSVVSTGRLLETMLSTNTGFALKAANSDGCFRNDSLFMQVISARSFSLGPDQSLCFGDTVTFAAPAGYKTYTWNTGATTNSLKAWQQGQYLLKVIDVNDCSTADSVLITSVFALPVPNLGSDISICAGSFLVLTPGNFSRYLWHNGSTQQSINASANGSYSVQVWDNNGCSASDSMQILAQLPLPAGFLAETDSICQYEKLILQPNATFKTYLWSNGSSQPTIQVDKPGIYGLKVTDNSNCSGTDSIRVIQKACMEGVYIPNAFTPNNDNLNDIFRPMVFGTIIKFEFSVYNRFGELIYQTREPGQGWDGKWKGLTQPANSYAWVCSYQLEGREAKVEKGMVALIR